MSLAVQHALHSFDPTQEREFLEYVERIDSCTTKQLIGTPRDIALAKDGKLVSNGFMLTHTAFKQLCQFTAKGLYGLVADIGAVAINTRSTEQFTSPALSADIINKVVDLRFHVPDGIATKALILNAESKTVDGIVGARYRYVPHHQLYSSVVEILDAEMGTVRFARALVDGRRCAVTFEVGDSCYVFRGGHIMNPTVHVTNSEAGEAGIHAAPGLTFVGCHLVDRAHLRHVAHSNNEFDARLQSLMAATIQQVRSQQLLYYAGRLEECLDVLDGTLSKVKRKRLVDSVAKYTGTVLADRVVRKAIFQGADRDTIPAQVGLADIAQRRKRDLVVLLCREGEGCCHSAREALESAAFNIIA